MMRKPFCSVFLYQRRSHSAPELRHFKKVILNCVPTKYEEYKKDSTFYKAYFNYATSCRLNGKTPLEYLTISEKNRFCNDLMSNLHVINQQALIWSGVFPEHKPGLRVVRSALAFLEEDFILREKLLSESLNWRILRNEGISEMNGKLVHGCDRDRESVTDLRGVPFSHNWWEFGEWTFADSNKRFGPTIFKDINTPLLPLLEFRKRKSQFINIKEPENVRLRPKTYLHFFAGIFERHLKLRHLSLHPVSTFDFHRFSEDGYLESIQCFDNLISYIFDHPNEITDPDEVNPLVIRSALQFMEEDIVPFIEGAQQIWQEFLNGNGMKRIDKLLQKRWNIPRIYRHLETIPQHHSWWPGKYRSNNSVRVADFATAFDETREKMLCFLQQLAETPESSPDLFENAHKFHEHYFNYARLCRKYKQCPDKMLGEGGLLEFQYNLPRALDNLITVLLNFQLNASILNIRHMRSSLEFLKEHQLLNEEFQKILKGQAVKELDEMLQEKMYEKSAHFFIYKGNLDGTPDDHTWWPEIRKKNM